MRTDENWVLADILLMAIMAAVLVFYASPSDWQLWARFLAAYWLGRVIGILLARIIP